MSAIAAALLAGAAAALIWPLHRSRALWHGMAPIRVAVLGVRIGRSRVGDALGRWPGVGRAGEDVVAIGLAVTAAGMFAAVAAGPVAALLAAACAGIVALSLRSRRAAGAASARRIAELEILSALAAELRSGRHPTAALIAVQAPADADLERALAAARATAALGGDVSASLRRSGTRPALLKLAAAWQLSEECGAPLADMLAQVAADVRAIGDVYRATQIELAGARATGMVLAVLPLLGVALGAAMGARPLQVLFHTPSGAACAVGGLMFEVAGLAWVRRLTNGTCRFAE